MKFEDNISNFKKRLIDGGYPQTMTENPLSDINREGVCTPETKQQRGKRNIAFRDTVSALSVFFKRSFNEKMESYTKPTVTSPNFKRIEPSIISYKKGKSLKDMLVRAKIYVRPVTPCIFSGKTPVHEENDIKSRNNKKTTFQTSCGFRLEFLIK